MKKMISLMLIMVLATVLFAGCTSTDASSSAATSEAAATEASAAASESAAEPAAAEPSAAPSTIEGSNTLPFVPTELSAGKTFGVSVMTHANPFFLKEVTAVEDTLKQGGIEATVLSPDPANDITTQVSQITEFCIKGVDVIFIDPIDVDGIKPALVEAQRVGIPVIIMDSAVADTDLITSFVESDNVALGKLSAESLCEAIGGEGEIGIVNWDTLGAVRDRVDGLKQVIEEKYNGKIEIVADQNAYGVVEDAQSIMESFMQSHPDIKGVFCINDPTAQGAIAAIESAGKSGQIFVSSVDGSQNGIDMIKEGKLVSSPVQFPATIANKAVELAEMIWAGKQDQVEPHIYIAGDNITAENADQYDGQTY